MSFGWPQPWTPVEDDKLCASLESELKRELGEAHPLFGLSVAAQARRLDCDDALFALGDGRIAVVHLTWTGCREADPGWPRFRLYPSLLAWAAAAGEADG